MNWIDLFIKPILLLLTAELIFSLYLYLKHIPLKKKMKVDEKKQFLHALRIPPINKENQITISPILQKLYPGLVFIFSLFILWLFPLSSSSLSFEFDFSIEFIFLFFIGIHAFSILLAFSSQNNFRIQTTKEITSKLINYLLPIILSLISNFILLTRFGIDKFTFSNLITLQLSNHIYLFGFMVPASLVFLNPFGFLAYLSALIGLNRSTTLDALPDESLRQWVPEEEFSGLSRVLLEFSKSVSFFLLSVLIFPFFLGSLWDSTGFWRNFLISTGFCLIFVILIAGIGRGTPRIKMDRKLKTFIRTPFVLAVFAIIWSIFMVF
jgi:NADH:ubiquinone oxidoreductase subunit H